MPDPNPIEYLRAWSAHCQLFWSRLQTAAILHSGVLVGWYKLPENQPILKICILSLGVLLSIFVTAIMVRDAQYLTTLQKKCGDAFPLTGHDHPKGRMCGFILVSIFPIIELILLGLTLLLPETLSKILGSK